MVPHEYEDYTKHVNLFLSSCLHLYFVSTSERLCETKAANKIAFLAK